MDDVWASCSLSPARVMMAVGLAGVGRLSAGRLPGDFMVRRGPVTFYFPLVTSIVISVVLTLLDDVLPPLTDDCRLTTNDQRLT